MAGVEKYFETVEETMRLAFRGWEADLSHAGEKGGIRERRVIDFLSHVLPKRYGIGTGHIVDCQGMMSNQTDIVIFDAVDGIVLPIDEYYSLFPCECVYAAIEVKSILTGGSGKGEISKCVENTRKLRSLNRNRNYDLPPIPSLVFAYETTWKKEQGKKTMEWFVKLGKPYSKRFPEAVFVLNPEPGFFFYPSGPTGYSTGEMSELVFIEKVPLLGFVSHLIQLLMPKKVLKPNLWSQYVDWSEENSIARVYTLQGLVQ